MEGLWLKGGESGSGGGGGDDTKPTELERICLYVLIALFSVGFLLSIGSVVWVLLRRRSWNLMKIVLILLPIPLLARDLDMIIHVHTNYLGQPLRQQAPLSIFLGGLPNYIFFSVFILLVLFWSIAYHRAHDRTPTFVRKMTIAYLLLNAVVYAVWVLLLSLMFSFHSHHENHKLTILHNTEAVYSSSLCFLAMLSFLLYGYRIYRKLRDLPLISSSRMKLCKLVGVLTLFLSLVFGCKFVIILVDIFVIDDSMHLINTLCFIANQVFFELTPAMAILSIFWIAARSSPSSTTNIYEAETAGLRSSSFHNGFSSFSPTTPLMHKAIINASYHSAGSSGLESSSPSSSSFARYSSSTQR
ncbi:hypothetical protein QOT17_011027 [Balamuthia mandrillaris]